MAQHKQCARTYIHMRQVMGHMGYMCTCLVHVRTTSTCAGNAMGGRSRQGNSCCTHQWTSTHLNLICALGQCLSILPPFLLHSTHTYTRYMCCCYVCISISFIGLWSHLRHSYDVTRSYVVKTWSVGISQNQRTIRKGHQTSSSPHRSPPLHPPLRNEHDV